MSGLRCLGLLALRCLGPLALSLASQRAAAAPASAPAPASSPASSPVSAPTAGTKAGPRLLLRQAMDLYLQGRYAQAAARLRPLVEARALADAADQLEALRTYGIAQHLSGAQAGAERAFRELLRRSPTERLDPDFVRPEVVRFFERVRTRHRAELDRVVARSAPRGSALVNLVPPWGQFQNGQPTKGWVVAGGLLVTGALAATTMGLWYRWRGDAGTFDGKEKTAQALQIVNLASAGLCAGFYLYGVIDGLRHYFRRRRAYLGPEQAHLGPEQASGDTVWRAASSIAPGALQITF